MENIVLILIAIFAGIAIIGLCCWRITNQSRVWLERGLDSTDILERRVCLRKAALLFNGDAMLAYACNNPDGFIKPKLLPFDYYIGIHHIPYIFADHYFAKGLTKWLSEEQKAFMKRIYAFKGLEKDCDDLVEEAIQKLGVNTDGVVVTFMPCSNDVRFKKKFQHFNPPKPRLWTWLRIATHKVIGQNR